MSVCTCNFVAPLGLFIVLLPLNCKYLLKKWEKYLYNNKINYEATIRFQWRHNLLYCLSPGYKLWLGLAFAQKQNIILKLTEKNFRYFYFQLSLSFLFAEKHKKKTKASRQQATRPLNNNINIHRNQFMTYWPQKKENLNRLHGFQRKRMAMAF